MQAKQQREAPPLVPLTPFPRGDCCCWFGCIFSDQILAQAGSFPAGLSVGQWFPGSEVHQDSGQQSN